MTMTINMTMTRTITMTLTHTIPFFNSCNVSKTVMTIDRTFTKVCSLGQNWQDNAALLSKLYVMLPEISSANLFSMF